MTMAQEQQETRRIRRLRPPPPLVNMQAMLQSPWKRSDPDSSYDPFQIFTVSSPSHHVLCISHLRGLNITKGWVGDKMDTPDPYLVFQVKNTPNGKKHTKHVDNNINPSWEETFEFCLDPNQNNVLEIKLMDSNYTVDEHIGTVEYDLSELPLNEKKEVSFFFGHNQKSQVIGEFLKKVGENSDLRYSLALCDEEKDFLQQRRKKVLLALQRLLGERGPKLIREVPIIGLLGSGGGFRAMVCLSGAMKALSEAGILDCITYVAGLSGSSWYLSTLYSHPDFPSKAPGELQQELKDAINHSPFALLSPVHLYKYLSSIVSKHLSGQPISFTDFFGHLLGDTLLKQRKETVLSNQAQKLEGGLVPLPLYTCLHVKKNVMAKVFQEWIEFSPYEVGIAKYGTYIKTSNFGSKLYIGCIVKKYPEYPLHYLQGVWGSAFCILFKQLIREKGRKDNPQMMRENESKSAEEELDKQLSDFVVTDEKDDSDSETEDDHETKFANLHANKVQESQNKENKMQQQQQQQQITKANKDLQGDNKNERRMTQKPVMTRTQTETSIWKGTLNNLFKNSWLDSCAGRAGMIHNPLRGLLLDCVYPISPFSPTTPNDDADFKGLHEALPTNAKKLYLVDSGLTFNSPYPLLLRPQRGVELYLSFDFSARPTDQTPPFKELLLAEKWAKANHLLFPPVEEQVKKYKTEPIRECYIFQDKRVSECPVILHFVIINNEFREYKSPGVKRETDEEKTFANFDIFDDPDNPYSLYNFSYSPMQFDRLSKLMEFNANHSMELIKDTISKCVERKRNSPPKPVISFKDIAKLKLKFRSNDALSQFKAYVQRLSRQNLLQNGNQDVPKKEEQAASSDEEYDTAEES